MTYFILATLVYLYIPIYNLYTTRYARLLHEVRQLRATLDASIGDVNRRLDAMGNLLSELRNFLMPQAPNPQPKPTPISLTLSLTA